MTKYIICLLGLILVAAGCGGGSQERVLETSIEQATGGDAEVNISNDKMEISGMTEDGEFSLTSGEGAEIPSNFPSDVPIYKPSTVISSMNMPEGQTVGLKTDDDSKKVTEDYKRMMTGEGWTEQASMNMGGQSVLMYEKGDRGAQITIVPMDNETQIMLAVGIQ